jgi:hypothetical protein
VQHAPHQRCGVEIADDGDSGLLRQSSV